MPSNDYGNSQLNEDLRSVSVTTIINSLRTGFKLSLQTRPVMINKTPVTMVPTRTGFGGYRYWFVCPTCGGRAGKVYVYGVSVSCRKCLSLTYRSSRFKGMVEGKNYSG